MRDLAVALALIILLSILGSQEAILSDGFKVDLTQPMAEGRGFIPRTPNKGCSEMCRCRSFKYVPHFSPKRC